jgi:undecaprenyl phosphate N,N'-diacetylbacillosamine 1-phosphate transferase
MKYSDSLKPVFDFVVSACVLLAFSPVILLLYVLLFYFNKGSVFFKQDRPGKNGHIFKLVKFKTMNDQKDAHGKLLPDADRITKIGKLVRSTSLDELPQLWNVLKGDMSLIGPRPFLVRYLPLYNSFQQRRHEVKPGITGWAQVNGRNAISWEKRFEYDVWYVDNISFQLDMKILWLTIVKVFKRDGISAEGEATMKAFRGTASNLPDAGS